MNEEKRLTRAEKLLLNMRELFERDFPSGAYGIPFVNEQVEDKLRDINAYFRDVYGERITVADPDGSEAVKMFVDEEGINILTRNGKSWFLPFSDIPFVMRDKIELQSEAEK